MNGAAAGSVRVRDGLRTGLCLPQPVRTGAS
jgi:hypothetical protein